MDIATRKIVISRNGPYLVSGLVPIAIESIGLNAQGGSWEWTRGRSFPTREIVALCRCGGSSSKPFCDGTHKRKEFDGTEVASRATHAEQAQVQKGAAFDLLDAEGFCAGARFCENFGSAWDLVEREDAPSQELVVHEVMRCPSGRLVLRDKQRGEVLEPRWEPSIGVVEDPSEDRSGPLWVRGGIPIESQDGTPYETRNRVTLCRCGRSQNKPFCDGSHLETGFKDRL